MTDFSNHFRPNPKSTPKEKKSPIKAWNDIKLRAIKKRLDKKKSVNIEDEIFYRNCYTYFVTSNLWICEECGSVLKKYNANNENFTYDIRKSMHHVAEKRTYPHLRHEIENICVLCWSCHQRAESIISFPKMKIYNQLAERKKQLLKS